jgi:hypothetical protein
MNVQMPKCCRDSIEVIDRRPHADEVPSIEVQTVQIDGANFVSTITIREMESEISAITITVMNRQNVSRSDAIERAKDYAVILGLDKIYTLFWSRRGEQRPR